MVGELIKLSQLKNGIMFVFYLQLPCTYIPGTSNRLMFSYCRLRHHSHVMLPSQLAADVSNQTWLCSFLGCCDINFRKFVLQQLSRSEDTCLSVCTFMFCYPNCAKCQLWSLTTQGNYYMYIHRKEKQTKINVPISRTCILHPKQKEKDAIIVLISWQI